MPPRQRARPYLYHAISKLLADEMVENFRRIGREFGMVGNAKEQMQGYARWVYVGGLTGGENVIDYSKDTGRDAAMKTHMAVCLQSQCDHSVYCNATNYLATTMRCNMSKVLNMAADAQKKLTLRLATMRRLETTWKLLPLCVRVSKRTFQLGTFAEDANPTSSGAR